MKQLTNLLVRCGHQITQAVNRSVCHLREWAQKYRRDVNTHLVRGLSYGVGSGAVSLVILWIQSRY